MAAGRLHAAAGRLAVWYAVSMPVRTPEDYVAQLRVMRDEMDELTSPSAEERKTLRNQMITSPEVLHMSINVIGMHPAIERGLGRSLDDVQRLEMEAIRWEALEAELRALLSGVAGANLVRRQRISLVAMQAYVIAKQLARDPAYANLIPQIEEIQRLRRLTRRRRKKAAEDGGEGGSGPAGA